MRIFSRQLAGRGADMEKNDLGQPFDIVFGQDATAPGALRVAMRDGWLTITTGDAEALVIEPTAVNGIRIRTPEAKQERR